jgi:hypothetical protein
MYKSEPASQLAGELHHLAGRRFGCWLICSSFSSLLLERTCSPPSLRVLHQSFSFFLSLIFPLSTAMIRTRRALKRWGRHSVVEERLVLRQKTGRKVHPPLAVRTCRLYFQKKGGRIVTTPRFTHPISVDFCRRKERNGWE